MLVIVYGTTGELIKLLPLIKSLKPDSYLTICTYQQPQQLKRLLHQADIKEADIKIGQKPDANDLESLKSIPRWFLSLWAGFFINRRKIKRQLKQSTGSNLLLVHGDTTTTLLGAVMGRLLGLPVGHIEAGLRSFNWRHPFPEELNRIYTSKIARIHFAPGKTPVTNLKKANTKGQIINTNFNTVLDSLRLAQTAKLPTKHKLPKQFCLISIHRNELLAQPKELELILNKIAEFSNKMPVVFLDHPITKERMRTLQFDQLMDAPGITRIPKLDYFSFISILAKAECVITDSGGLQEETAYLGIPCLVHRKATEREEGLGKNVVLSLYQAKKVDEFLANHTAYKTEGVSKAISPTKIILDSLKSQNFIA